MTTPATRGGIVSIDAGQSSVRVRVRGVDGVRTIDAPGLRNDRSTVEQIAALLGAEQGYGAEAVAVGLSGFDGDPESAARLLAAGPSLRRVAVAHDSITGYLAANGDSLGAVAAVGTGVVVLGVGPTSVARVDGYGALLGDCGGAYWIGRAGLEAALRAGDGRGPATILTDAATDTFGALELIHLRVQADPDRVAAVAAFARRVTAAAPTDAVALRITREASGELAHSVITALDRARVPEGSSRVSAVGQVLTSTLLAAHLAEELERRRPGLVLHAPLAAPIDGVESLHDLGRQHPLAPSVVIATR